MKSTTIEEQIELLAFAAIAQMHAVVPDETNQQNSTEDLAREQEEDDCYFDEVAVPLGEQAAVAGIAGSDVIGEERGE